MITIGYTNNYKGCQTADEPQRLQGGAAIAGPQACVKQSLWTQRLCGKNV